MSEVIYDIKEKPDVEQIREFLSTLTEQQQREFLLMIQGAQITMRLVRKERDNGRSA